MRRGLACLCALVALVASAQPKDQDVLVPEGEPEEVMQGLAWAWMGKVHSVAFSPDGRLLATGSRDGTVRLWEVASGRELRHLDGHADLVVFSPDGSLLATAPKDNTVCLWEAATGKPLATLQGHSDAVVKVAFSPDGSRILTASNDHTARLWEAATGKPLATLQGHSDAVLAVAFSPDGSRVLTASNDHTARLWEAATGKPLATLEHSASVSSVVFSPDGRLLATASDEDTARLWEAKTGKLLVTLQGHSRWVRSVAFSPDGRLLATASDDNTARLWDLTSGRELRRLDGHSDPLSSIAFSPDGRFLATASYDHTVRLWDVASGREFRRLGGQLVSVPAAFSPDGRLVVTASDKNTARLWDLTSGRELRRFDGHSGWVGSVAFSPNNRLLATGSLDKTARLWDLVSGQELRHLDHWASVSSVAFSPDGLRLVTGSVDGLRYWEVTSGRELRLATASLDDSQERVAVTSASDGKIRYLHGPSILVSLVAFSPNGHLLATNSSENTARLWDLTTGRELRRLDGHSGRVQSVAFSPDGRFLATGSDDHTGRLWNVTSGRELLRLDGHSDSVVSVAFSPDGRLLATGSDDNSVRLWDLPSGRQRRSFKEEWPVRSVAFSRDGSLLTEGSGFKIRSTADGKVWAERWDGPPGWLYHRAGQKVFRHDDGRLLYRKRVVDGALEPVPPPLPSTPARLTAEASLSRAPGDDGEVGELLVHVTNAPEGGRAYWIRVEPVELPQGLVLLPPETVMRLEPGDSVDLKVGLSYLSPGEGSGPIPNAPLRLKLHHAHGEGPVVSTRLRIKAPRLVARVSRVDKQAVTLALRNEGDQALGPLTLDGVLDFGKGKTDEPEQRLEDLKPGEERAVALAIPYGLAWTGRFSLLLTGHSGRWPRTWKRDFPNLNARPPYELYAALAAGALLLAFALYYLRVYRDPVVVGVARRPETIKEFPLAQLPAVDRALERAQRKLPTLAAAQLPEARWARVLKGAGPAHEAASAFAEAVGGTLGHSLGEGAWALTLPPLRIRFAEQTAVLVVDGPRLEDGAAMRRAAPVLQAGAGPSKVLVLDRTEVQNAAAAFREVPGGTFVVLSSDDLRRLLLAEHPRQQLEAIISQQVPVSELSPYRTAGGVEAEAFFFGRERELRTIVDQRLRNFLVVGPRQMGKSTLLKALERRMKARADVEVHYLVLGGPDLVRSMARRREPELPPGAEPPPFEQLAAGTRERPQVWLIDEADDFIATDARMGYPLLRTIRALAEEGRALFVFAGFWELYRAAVFDETGPLRNFAETLRLPPLEPDASRRLVIEPMGALGLSWDAEETVAHLVDETGRRANLLVLACKGLVETLPADTRTLTRAHLERVLREAPDLRDQSRRWRGDSPLHRAVVRQALLLGRPTREEVRKALQTRGFQVSSQDFDRALDHVELGYVLITDAEGRLHCPVPLMRRFIEAERSLELGLEEDLEDFRSGRSEAPPSG